MQQLWPCIIRYLNSACGMPQHPLYWLNFHPAHSKEEGGGEGAGGGGGGAVGDVTNRQLALKIKSFSCLTRFRTCMERAGYMCEYSVRNTIQQPSSYPPNANPYTNPNLSSKTSSNYNRNRRRDAATEPLSAQFPMSASCPWRVLPSLIPIPIVIPCCPLPFPSPSLCPFHLQLLLLGFDFVAWPCNFNSHRKLTQRIYLACCLCICITLWKKRRLSILIAS